VLKGDRDSIARPKCRTRRASAKFQSPGCKFAGNSHPAAPLKFAHPNRERLQKEEWVMENDNMIPLELTDDELDVVPVGGAIAAAAAVPMSPC
jgi:hypothetical protein